MIAAEKGEEREKYQIHNEIKIINNNNTNENEEEDKKIINEMEATTMSFVSRSSEITDCVESQKLN